MAKKPFEGIDQDIKKLPIPPAPKRRYIPIPKKLKGEPDKWYDLFVIYCELGASRTTERLKNVVKSRGLQVGQNKSYINARERYNWIDRTKIYDDQILEAEAEYTQSVNEWKHLAQEWFNQQNLGETITINNRALKVAGRSLGISETLVGELEKVSGKVSETEFPDPKKHLGAIQGLAIINKLNVETVEKILAIASITEPLGTLAQMAAKMYKVSADRLDPGVEALADLADIEEELGG